MDKMKVVKIGRPSGYSVDVADTICQEIMTGKSLREICAREDMPGASTVYSWLREHPEFQEAYVQAREVQADVLADEIIEQEAVFKFGFHFAGPVSDVEADLVGENRGREHHGREGNKGSGKNNSQ